MTEAVFVPGLLCTGALFDAQKKALDGTLDIAVGDHRAHDNFPGTARGILDGAPERFVFAGLSMGGYAGFEIMRRAPECVEALILLNTSARADTPEQTERRKGLIEMAKTQGLDAVVDALLPMFVAEKNLDREEVTSAVRRMAHETGLDAFLRQQAAIMGRPDSQDTLGAIQCPTLVIVGADDALTPPGMAREMADGIPGARLEVIGDCGHLSTIEQPEAVNDAIRSFLKEAGISG